MQRLSRISGTTGGTLRTTQVAESYQVRWSHYEIIINVRLYFDFPDLEQLRWEKTNEEFIKKRGTGADKPPMDFIKVKQNLLDWTVRELGNPNGNGPLCSRNVKLFNFKSQVGFMLEPMFSTQH